MSKVFHTAVLWGSFTTIMLAKISMLFYPFWRKCQSFEFHFQHLPIIYLTVSIHLTCLFTSMSVSIYAVHENRQKGFDLKAALLSEQRDWDRNWRLVLKIQRHAQQLTAQLIRRRSFPPQMIFCLNFLKSSDFIFSFFFFWPYSIPTKCSVLSSTTNNPDVSWETKDRVLTELISAPPSPSFLLLLNKGELLGDREEVEKKEIK